MIQKLIDLVLQESKAGLAVGKLRTNASKAIAEAAKDLVKKWKSEVEAAKAKGSPKVAAAAGTPVALSATNHFTDADYFIAGKPIAAAASTASVKSPVVENTVRNNKTDGVKTDITGDKARDKCVELIYNALAAGSGARMLMSFLRSPSHR
jgi:transcription elongation factor S-II